MKLIFKTSAFIFMLFFLLVLSIGCTQQEETTSKNQSESQPNITNQETIQNNSGSSESSINSEDNSASETQEENTTDNPTIEGTENFEADNLGTPATGNGAPIPEEMVGVWTITTGLPQGLESYSLTINADGSTTQNTQGTDGSIASTPMTTVSTDNGYAVTDSYGNTLLTFTFENGQLISQNLSPETAVFEKSQ